MAKRSFFIKIAGDIDSMALWKIIEQYGVNLTAVIGESWVYGDIELHYLGTIVECCALFGPLKIDVQGGVQNEPQKKESETQDTKRS